MKLNSIKCEAINVKSEDKVCIGIAKTKEGEACIFDGRTPENSGMCVNALCSLSNAAFIMMTSKDTLCAEDDHIDRVCPHGNVTFRLSRSKTDKTKPFNKK